MIQLLGQISGTIQGIHTNLFFFEKIAKKWQVKKKEYWGNPALMEKKDDQAARRWL